jgi:hypothetical protein
MWHAQITNGTMVRLDGIRIFARFVTSYRFRDLELSGQMRRE